MSSAAENAQQAQSARALRPTNLTLFASLLHPISLSMDLLLAAGEHVLAANADRITLLTIVVPGCGCKCRKRVAEDLGRTTDAFRRRGQWRANFLRMRNRCRED